MKNYQATSQLLLHIVTINNSNIDNIKNSNNEK